MGQRKFISVIAAAATNLLPMAASAATPLEPQAVTARDHARIVAELNYQAVVNFADGAQMHVQMLETERPDFMVRLRRSCAFGDMPAILSDIAADRRKVIAQNGHAAPMPDQVTYCRAVLTESLRRGLSADLYKDLAVQEQGVARASETSANLLSHNEAWNTTMAILTAANAGGAAYTAISGASRPLTCALALDAGATWAASDANATLPMNLEQADTDAITRACYDPAIKRITVNGTVMPAQKAGLLAGVWLESH